MIKRKIPLKQIQQQVAATPQGVAWFVPKAMTAWGPLIGWIPSMRTTRGVRQMWSRRRRRALLARCKGQPTIKLKGLGWVLPTPPSGGLIPVAPAPQSSAKPGKWTSTVRAQSSAIWSGIGIALALGAIPAIIVIKLLTR